MTATAFPAIWTDSIVVDVPTGKIYKVVKVNPKNVKCVSPTGALWNISATRLRRASEAQEADFASQAPAEPAQYESYRLGTVCRFKAGSGYAQKFGRPVMVVTKQKAGDIVSLAWLGGDPQSRYFASVPIMNLERVAGEVTVTNV